MEQTTTKQIPVEIANTYQPLFDLLNKEHGLILTISEMDEVIKAAKQVSK